MAAISALHAKAKTANATDWSQIAALYDTIAKMTPSVVVEVNRAVAVAMSQRMQRVCESDCNLKPTTFIHVTRGEDLLRRINQREAAADACERSLYAATTRSARIFSGDRTMLKDTI